MSACCGLRLLVGMGGLAGLAVGVACPWVSGRSRVGVVGVERQASPGPGTRFAVAARRRPDNSADDDGRSASWRLNALPADWQCLVGSAELSRGGPWLRMRF